MEEKYWNWPEWMKISGKSWKCLNMDADLQKSRFDLAYDGGGSVWMQNWEMAGNCQKWLDIARNSWKGWKQLQWLKWQKITGIAGNDL